MLAHVQSRNFKKNLQHRTLGFKDLFAFAVCSANLLDGAYRVRFFSNGQMRSCEIGHRAGQKKTVLIFENSGIYYLLLQDCGGKIMPHA